MKSACTFCGKELAIAYIVYSDGPCPTSVRYCLLCLKAKLEGKEYVDGGWREPQ